MFGRIDPAQGDRLDSHLDHCDTCQTVLAACHAEEDTLVAALRQGVCEGEFDHQPQLRDTLRNVAADARKEAHVSGAQYPSRSNRELASPLPQGSGTREATRNKLTIAVALFGGLLAALGLTMFLKTPAGILRIEINDPGIELTVKGTQYVLKGAETKDISLTPSDHILHIRRGDFEFDTKSLQLSKGDLVVVKVVAIRRLKGLRHLDLARTQITDAGLEPLAELPQLKLLNLDSTAITDAGLAQLEPLSVLRDLKLRWTKVTSAGVGKLQAALPDCKIEWNAALRTSVPLTPEAVGDATATGNLAIALRRSTAAATGAIG